MVFFKSLTKRLNLRKRVQVPPASLLFRTLGPVQPEYQPSSASFFATLGSLLQCLEVDLLSHLQATQFALLSHREAQSAAEETFLNILGNVPTLLLNLMFSSCVAIPAQIPIFGLVGVVVVVVVVVVFVVVPLQPDTQPPLIAPGCLSTTLSRGKQNVKAKLAPHLQATQSTCFSHSAAHSSAVDTICAVIVPLLSK